MRPALLALFIGAIVGSPATANDVPRFADAPLRAVQFVDDQEGWAVGDEGVIWHTIDGGQTWERQPTGVRASLQSLHFLDPFTGFVVGTEGLPFRGGSSGVILFTRDGGVQWDRISVKELPGLHKVKFLDKRTGFLAGAASDQFPTGLFVTEDAGVTWKPIPGDRCPGWLTADFVDAQGGVLGGSWGTLSPMRRRELLKAEINPLGNRAIRGLQLQGRTAWAVGDGGIVMTSADTMGKEWKFADLQLPPEVRTSWDFHALHFVGDHGWMVGRPGSVVLHTWDRGESWQAQPTKQTLPLHGVFFVNERCGWAVGELGTILATTDCGKTWKVQRRGGHRAAVLVITAQGEHLPAGTVALLGADEGYLTSAVRVTSSDPKAASFGTAHEGVRLAEAVRSAGGCGGEMLWHFPLPGHLQHATASDLAKAWGQSQQDEAKGYEELTRQLVLALRVWRPDVIITDNPDPRSATGQVGGLVALAVGKAFDLAGKADAFPEQIAKLDLQPWNPNKLYGRWETANGANLTLDLETARPLLRGSALDYAAPTYNLLVDATTLPQGQLHYRLLASRLEGADKHKHLMEGVKLEWGGQARREMTPVDDQGWERIVKAVQRRRDFLAIAKEQSQDPVKATQMPAVVGKALEGLSEEPAGAAAFALGQMYAQSGQWHMAKEVLLLMLDRYPTHRLAPDACRWLIQHGTSSEARRREELKQFLVAGSYQFQPPVKEAGADGKPPPRNFLQRKGGSALLRRQDDLRQWYKSSLALGDIMAAYGPLYYQEPDVQFSLQAARRNLGQFDEAQLWYSQFKLQQTTGPWCDAAGAELWLTSKRGMSSKPTAMCQATIEPPFLDGKFDEDCWKNAKPIPMKNAVGTTATTHPTEAWLSFDANFLYLALRCKHPSEGHYVAPVKPRPRDDDLRAFDRVSLLLDLDRDYATYFHFQVDQRGCVFEDCWGDKHWNPKWYVAIHSDESSWQIEAAIPLIELTGDPIRSSQTWACNVVRTLPGKGVQAFSTPADVSPRPEGMGLLQFSATEGLTMPPPARTTKPAQEK